MIDHGFGVKLIKLDHKKHFHKTLEWRNKYKIWKWCRQNDLLTEIDHASWFERLDHDKSIKMYGIINGHDVLVGVCGLTDIDRINQRAEFSLYIGPEHQKKGFGKAALKTLLCHGFLAQNMNLIWGETFDKNPALEMFFEIGMLLDGVRREFYFNDGCFIDANLVSITKEEFQENLQLWMLST